MNPDIDLFNGTKRGDNVRIILRNKREIRNAPTTGNSVMLLLDGRYSDSTMGIITAAKVEDDILDLTVTSYYKTGHKFGDGEVALIVVYRDYKKGERLQ